MRTRSSLLWSFFDLLFEICNVAMASLDRRRVGIRTNLNNQIQQSNRKPICMLLENSSQSDPRASQENVRIPGSTRTPSSEAYVTSSVALGSALMQFIRTKGASPAFLVVAWCTFRNPNVLEFSALSVDSYDRRVTEARRYFFPICAHAL